MNYTRENHVKKMVLAAMLACLSYVCSTFVYFPRMAPFQHLFNVLGAVFLGPWWGLACAAVTGIMRMLLGGRTIQALIGAVVGAFLAGLLYRRTKKIGAAAAGEIFGTGILGALLVYPFMVQFYGLPAETPFWTFIPSYVPSSALGAGMACVLLKTFERTGLLRRLKEDAGE
ncbi:MAG: energy coupling factor transporter S component ThiW [Lachnospiraceae bacterium]|nr:energy coupling factor transporter S component ThiW [Lachnospiraceae bacterium]